MIHVSSHAVSRYRSRVAPVSDEEARAILKGPAIETAANFGASFVKLGTGQRVVLEGRTVVTVLPVGVDKRYLDPRRDPHTEGRRG